MAKKIRSSTSSKVKVAVKKSAPHKAVAKKHGSSGTKNNVVHEIVETTKKLNGAGSKIPQLEKKHEKKIHVLRELHADQLRWRLL